MRLTQKSEKLAVFVQTLFNIIECNVKYKKYARVAELVDALDLGSSSGNRVGVQLSPFAPRTNKR